MNKSKGYIEDRTSEQIELFNGFLHALSSKYKVSKSKFTSIKNFHLFKSKNDPKIVDGYTIVSNDNSTIDIVLVEYDFTFDTATEYGPHRITDRSYYLFSRINLKRNFGYALIRPETIKDKITEYFIKSELDFKTHKKFSFKYYVLAEDKKSFESLIPKKLLSYLSPTSGISLEFRNTNCLLRLKKSFSIKQGEELVELSFDISEILNE